jgi:hypothetical protein
MHARLQSRPLPRTHLGEPENAPVRRLIGNTGLLLCAALLLTSCAAPVRREIVAPAQECPKPIPVTCPDGADAIPDLLLADLPSAETLNALSDQQKLRVMLDASVTHRLGQMQMRDQLTKAVQCQIELRRALEVLSR